ncbi:hypothetical protein N9N67_10735 [Bacteriovoracaceae bacterium]|nr:hypothetical protein [Bacteriovoracaceae bacterium]
MINLRYLILLTFFTSCEKVSYFEDGSKVEYLIKAGRHYSSMEIQDMTGENELKGRLSISQPEYYHLDRDQHDWNKAIGFSDCSTVNAFHGKGAILAWRWNLNEQQSGLGEPYLEFAAYVHNSSDQTRDIKIFEYRKYKSEINAEFQSQPQIDFSIKIDPSNHFNYIFELNGESIVMTGDQGRGCNASVIVGHLHHPWFGGNKPAPHDINFVINFF